MSDRRTEARHPGSAGLHALPGRDVLSLLLDAQIAAASAIHPALQPLERAAELAAGALRAGHRVAYAGAGSSGLMALADCLELAGTFGIAPDRTPLLFAGGAAALLHMTGGVEDDPDLAQADVARLAPHPGDVVICLAASGTTPYTLRVAEAAKAAGATVIGFSNTADAPLLALADVPVLLDTGPEVVAGSTRLGAATAQKIALNLLSVLVGLRLGHVHDGYMVNLVADNAKLVDRAARIVAGIAGTGTEAATAALAQTGGAVKPAVLIAAGASAQAARDALAISQGHLAPALRQIIHQS